jgi:hypothetical protein
MKFRIIMLGIMTLNITILSVTMEERRGCRNKLIYSKEHTETFLNIGPITTFK